MVMACEYMTNIGVTRQYIQNAQIPELRDHLAIANPIESQDFLRSLHQLVLSGALAEETALLASPNPAELKRRLKGISASMSGN
jgi:Tfp pilus assembly pilus retraction ATPase PilT